MDKDKITITVILIVGLLFAVAFFGFILVVTTVNDVLFWTGGYVSLLAFILSAFILGTCINKVVKRVKKLWE
jgi:hypothetical protein